MNITNNDIARALDVTIRTVHNKRNGSTDWLLSEYNTLIKYFGQEEADKIVNNEKANTYDSMLSIDDKMEENNMSEKANVVTVGVKGTVMYPKKEDGVQKYAIRINDEQAEALDRLVSKTFGAMSLTYGEDEETGDKLLNVKSQYDVPMFDGDGNELSDIKVNHGADVVASIVVKEYEYKKRHGVTAYLKGFVIYKNGESQSGTDFKSIMGNVL